MNTHTRRPEKDGGGTGAAGGELNFGLTAESDYRQSAFPGEREVWAMVHAETAPAGGSRHLPPGDIGVLIAVDFAPDRVAATRLAVATAIDRLPDGVRFALVEKRPDKDGVLRQPELRVADDHTRSQARADAEWLRVIPPKGGTSYAAWLAQAREMFFSREDTPRVRHLLMITDGSGRTAGLEAELEACVGQFTCDVLGVGAEWQLHPLTRIAEALHGTADYAWESEEITEWLTSAMDRPLRTRVPMVPLEVTLRQGVELKEIIQFSEQRRPLEQLTGPENEAQGPAAGHPRRYSFATRLWAPEYPRDFELVLVADPTGDPLDEDVQLATVTIGSACVPLLVHWSYKRGSDRGKRTFTGQRSRVVRALIDGCQALDEGALSVAERELGTAVRLAHESRDGDVLQPIREVVDVVDAAAGEVRLRRRVDPQTLKETQLHARHVPPSPPAGGSRAEPGRTSADGAGAAPEDPGFVSCSAPECVKRSVRGARFCVRCGAPL